MEECKRGREETLWRKIWSWKGVLSPDCREGETWEGSNETSWGWAETENGHWIVGTVSPVQTGSHLSLTQIPSRWFETWIQWNSHSFQEVDTEKKKKTTRWNIHGFHTPIKFLDSPSFFLYQWKSLQTRVLISAGKNTILQNLSILWALSSCSPASAVQLLLRRRRMFWRYWQKHSLLLGINSVFWC